MSVIATVDGVEGSAPVIRTGEELATAFDEELVVLHVGPPKDGEEAVERVARDAIEAAIGSPEGKNVRARAALGEPATEILERIREDDPHYVVMGSRKRTPVGKAILGSVAQLVMLNSSVPVVSVQVDET